MKSAQRTVPVMPAKVKKGKQKKLSEKEAVPSPPMHCRHSMMWSLEGLRCVGCAFCAYEVIIRLLWNETADGTNCDENCTEHGEPPYPICEAFRVLGWGEHYDREVFQRNAMRVLSWRETPPSAPSSKSKKGKRT